MSIFKKHKPQKDEGGGHSKKPGSNGLGNYSAGCPKCGASFTENDMGRAKTAVQIHLRNCGK